MCPVHVAHILVLLLCCLALKWLLIPHLSSSPPSCFALGLVEALFSVSSCFWCFVEILQLPCVFLLFHHLLRPSSSPSLFPVCLVHGGLVFVFPLVSFWLGSGSCWVLFVPLVAVSPISVVIFRRFAFYASEQSACVAFAVFCLAACSFELVCFFLSQFLVRAPV